MEGQPCETTIRRILSAIINMQEGLQNVIEATLALGKQVKALRDEVDKLRRMGN